MTDSSDVSAAEVGLTIRDVLARAARLYPRDAAVIHGDRVLSWDALQRRCYQLANALLARGVGRGSRVAILQISGPEVVEIAYATALLGATLVPLSDRLSLPEVQYIVDDAAVRFAFVGAESAGAELFSSDRVIRTRCADYEAVLAAASEEEPPELERQDDIAMQLYTSGTTGRPKGALASQRALIQNGLSVALSQGLLHSDVFLSATPLTHAMGCTRLIGLAVDGIAHVILEKFREEDFFSIVARHRVTTTVLVPTMIAQLLDHPGFEAADLTSLQLLVYGAAPCPPSLIERAVQRFGCDLINGYGLTEGCPALTMFSPDDHRKALADPSSAGRLGSIGRPVPGVRVRVADELGRPVPPGTTGELQVRSTKAMTGYWHLPTETSEALKDGWLRTGDVVVEDEEGYLFLIDRKKDMLISGGLNVYPSEIERVLRQVKGVADVAVVGAPDPRWGEVPVAFVVTADGELDEQLSSELRTRCRAELAGYKQPKLYKVVAALPRNATGKVLKAALRELVHIEKDA